MNWAGFGCGRFFCASLSETGEIFAEKEKTERPVSDMDAPFLLNLFFLRFIFRHTRL